MTNLFGTKDIKFYVNLFIKNNASLFASKAVIDVPAGNGVTSESLLNAGAKVVALDLFPDFFTVKEITCSFCDIEKEIPLASQTADFIFCQEGIEHLSNQLKVFTEFNRVLKTNGSLFITTPNYSNLKSKVSYLLTESEYFNKIMPPNEVDDLWFSGKNSRHYYGHLFLIGAQKLRTFAALNGFKIKHLYGGKISGTSLFFLFLFFPFIYLSNYITLRKNLKKKKHHAKFKEIKIIYYEIFKLNTSFKILVCTHLFIEFEKIKNTEMVDFSIFSKHATNEFAT
ncbi:MAG: class I SAM-dependent methyltransferase [Bacteroidia bacterium]|nr:class I SAM-dependent methyltransferase [Bacteroidia bacterium]